VRRAGGPAGGRAEAPASGAKTRAERPTAQPLNRSTAQPPIDRTAKLYIGGKQARPDGGYSLEVVGADGRTLGQVGRGNRKDIRNAVEAAHKAAGWGRATAHLRAQVLYYVAENLEARAAEFADRIRSMTGDADGASGEVAASVRRLFHWVAWADKWDGRVHHTPYRNVTLAMPEPIGVIGIACPDTPPLLGFVSLVAPAVAMGNTVVAVPSERHPLTATDLYQVLDTSDLPAGVVNIVTGRRDELAEVLARHDDVDAVWYCGPAEGGAAVERLSVGNMKRVGGLRTCAGVG
jgi:aldehyde dehydrogenase (NAD+)